VPLIKQWVNLEPGFDEALRDVPGEGVIPPERCGPIIHLEATIDQEEGGLPVWWGVEVHDDNLEPGETPDGGWSSNPRLAGLGGVPGFYEQLAITDDGGVTRAELHVPECGGDKYTVKVFTKDGEGNIADELQSETYETWRQLYYQVTRMDGYRGRIHLEPIPEFAAWDDVKNEYADARKPHNIRFTEVPAGSAVISRHRCLWNEAMQQRTGVEGYCRDKEPLVLKVSLVDLLAERGQETHTFDVVIGQTTYRANCNNILFDVNSDDDRDDWFISGRVRVRGRRDPRLGPDNVERQGLSTVRVTLEEMPGCRGAEVEIRVYVFDPWWGGFSWYNGIWIQNADGREEVGGWTIAESSEALRAAIMVHEFGHAIGMVAEDSPKHYPTSHLHQGNHCWNGATDPSSFPAGDEYTWEREQGAICTMFGSTVAETTRYCDICSPFVRSRKPSVDGNFKRSLMMPEDWGSEP